MIVTFHVGGFDRTIPNNNLASFADVATKTYTEWDEAGNVISTRPLTASELETLTPPTAPPNPAADQLEAAAQSASQAALEDVRALAPLLQAAADALRSA